MKKQIRLGLLDSIIYDILSFFKINKDYKKYNPLFYPNSDLILMNNMFEMDLYDIIISNSDISEESNYTNCDFIEFNNFYKIVLSNNIRRSSNKIRVGIPNNHRYFKNIIKNYIYRNFGPTKKIEYKIIRLQDIGVFIDNNLIDLSVSYEPYIYDLFDNNSGVSIDNIDDFKFYFFIKSEYGLDFIKELKTILNEFLNNEEYQKKFLKYKGKKNNEYIKLYLNTIEQNIILHDFTINSITQSNIQDYGSFIKSLYYRVLNKKFGKLNNKNKDNEIDIKDIKLQQYILDLFNFLTNDIIIRDRIQRILFNKTSSEKNQFSNYNVGEFLKKLDSSSEEIIIQKVRAEEAIKSKNLFFASITHDIKTPISAIISLSELLLDKYEDSENEELIMIHETAKNLLNLIHEVLTLSKLEIGKLKLNKTVISLEKIVENVVNNLKATNKNNNVKIFYDISDFAKKNYIGDSVKINQILYNLGNNGLKFTEKGYVKISADQIFDSEKYSILQFSVKDTGKGINQDKISDIFNPFQQEDNETQLRYGGYGIGLANVKKLIELMNGKIHCISKVGEGSEFIFEIKLEKENDYEIINDIDLDIEIVNKEIDNSKINHVLIAEDTVVNRKIIVKIMNIFNLNYKLVSDGKEAIDYYLRNKDLINFVITDIQMPIINGIELSDKLRESGYKGNIVAYTASDEIDYGIQITHKFDRILTKPYTKEKFIKLFGENKLKNKKNTISESNEFQELYMEEMTDNYDLLIDIYDNKDFNNDNTYLEIRKVAHSIKGAPIFGGDTKFNEIGKSISNYAKSKNKLKIYEYLMELKKLIKK